MDLRARIGVGALVAGLLLTAGLAAIQGTDRAEARRKNLPELPPSALADPDRYDAEGCLRVDEGTVDCGASAADLDRARLGASESDVRQLAGFSGPYWTEDLSADAVTVLEPTVFIAPARQFLARGLARNETGTTVPAVTITASLEDADGAVIAVIEAASPVGPVRPGEPVPFELGADTDPAAVASVEWSARAEGDAPTGPRTAEWQPYYELPGGDRDRVELYLHSDPARGPLPHLLYGSVGNVGPNPMAGPALVTAFFDEQGRVVAIGDTPVSTPTGQATAELAPEAAADALVAAETVRAGGQTMVWITAQG